MDKKTDSPVEEFKRNPALNIFQRMNLVMGDLDYIQKEEKKVNNQYSFASHDKVTAALHGPLTKYGIACIPTCKEVTQDGNRTVIKVEVAFINIDKPEDRFSVDYIGYGIDPADKGPGKAISYAFKYALLKVFCLETGDDPDNEVKSVYLSKDNPKKGNSALATPIQLRYLEEYFKENPAFLEPALKPYRVSRLTALTSGGAKELITRIENSKEKKDEKSIS